MPTYNNEDFNYDDPRLTYDGEIVTPWDKVSEPKDIWTEVVN